MVDFLGKRLQVFVSSTFSDLILERQSAVEAILTSGHIPAGMELFTSGDESQMEVIKQWIDESDVYLLILGGRYGSIEKNSNKSYTQLEYEYAISQSKPIFSCVITDNALEGKVKQSGSSVIETHNPKQLKEFRDLALSKTVHFWEDEKDIKIAVGETLSHVSRRDDLVGWVRPHQEANMPALVDEIARLSKENSLLRSQLSNVDTNNDIHGLSFSDLLMLLKKENLLHVFSENRVELAAGLNSMMSSNVDDNEMKSLCLYGLLTSPNQYFYRLTNEGRVFINKLKLKEMKNE